MTRILTALTLASALALPIASTPVAAQSQRGLVNVQVYDITLEEVVSDITVNVGTGLNIAANICGVNVGVLATQLGQEGVAFCSNGAQDVTLTRLGL